MTDLLLIFLGAACLDDLVLACLIPGTSRTGRRGEILTLAAAVSLLCADALLSGFAPAGSNPGLARVFLHMLAFACTASAIAQGCASMSPLVRPLVRRLRAMLPLLAGNVAVVLVASLDSGHARAIQTILAFCVGASLLMALVVVGQDALRERIEFARAPRSVRGAPLAVITLCIVALAWAGCARSLPW